LGRRYTAFPNGESAHASACSFLLFCQSGVFDRVRASASDSASGQLRLRTARFVRFSNEHIPILKGSRMLLLFGMLPRGNMPLAMLAVDRISGFLDKRSA